MKNQSIMYQQIEKHGENLNAIFNTGLEPVTLCKKLRRLEAKAHRLATDYCNGENGVTTDNWESKCAPIIKQVKSTLKCADDCPIFINGDARGYALKIKASHVRALQTSGKNIYTDMGGYGILAPDFTPNS